MRLPRFVPLSLLWGTISAGDPIAAYVRNQTADGAGYWVLASVVPIISGYLSVRLAPGSRRESHPPAPTDPHVSLSTHTARAV